MLPLEYVVIGTPKSLRASGKSKQDWKRRIRAAATAALPAIAPVSAASVRVTVVYFYVQTDLDTDNILKPILDAMKDLVYEDDKQVIDIIAAKRDLAVSYALSGVSPVVVAQLVSAATDPKDFIFVRVEAANEGVLP